MSDLTLTEQANVRAALRFLYAQCGTRATTAKALHANVVTLRLAARDRPVSASLAMRVARLVKVPVDDVLQGRFPPAGTCPHCGARVVAEAAQ